MTDLRRAAHAAKPHPQTVRVPTLSFLRWIALALTAGAIVISGVYLWQMGRAYDRIAGQSQVIDMGDERIEYVQGGSGTPVLVVHGSGGGFDQGALIASAVIGDGFRWIAPSRYGYLRSTLPSGATFETQADAYARLLDHLGIRQTAVVALSQGGPSALFFALKYPERVQSLVLLSCGVASSSDAQQAEANRSGDLLKMIFKYDFAYWGVSTALRKPLMKLMGASDEVIAGLAPGQRQVVDQVIDFMNPVHPRYAGVELDNRAAMPNERIAAIRAPTLIVHATDDTLQLYRNAEFAAATIPGARLRGFERGGHLLIAVEQPRISAEVQAFIRSHSAQQGEQQATGPGK
ncbi:MAG TPA: alpha/beta hydrolase [Burkholderiaceae bacterium]|nr:alpha/beta hydrolase [Burkholderiaceae bacterium]